MSQATYGLHGRKIKVQLLKEKEPGNCEGKRCGVISLDEVILLSVTVYFPAILFSLWRFLKLLPGIISECCVQLLVIVNLVKLCIPQLSGALCSKQPPSKGLSTPHPREFDRKKKGPGNNVAKQGGEKLGIAACGSVRRCTVWYICVLDQAWGHDGWVLAKFLFLYFSGPRGR